MHPCMDLLQSPQLLPFQTQTFQTYFPGLPLPVVDALLDLYTQVLRNINANSKVGCPVSAGTLASVHGL